jgi:hypothetical protein
MQRTNLTFSRCVNSDDPGRDLENLNTPEPAAPEPDPLADSVKAKQRRKMAKSTAEQARVLTPGRMAHAGGNPSPVEAIHPEPVQLPVRCCPKCGRPLPAKTPTAFSKPRA